MVLYSEMGSQKSEVFNHFLHIAKCQLPVKESISASITIYSLIPAPRSPLPADSSINTQLIGSSFVFLKKKEDGYQH
jgi:hypothetical protein